MTKSRAWTYVGIVAGLTTAVIVADVKFNSQASEQIVVQRAYDSRQQDTIKTNPIYGSDASTSTYGLDPARVVDW
jgi:hypothetical protein